MISTRKLNMISEKMRNLYIYRELLTKYWIFACSFLVIIDDGEMMVGIAGESSKQKRNFSEAWPKIFQNNFLKIPLRFLVEDVTTLIWYANYYSAVNEGGVRIFMHIRNGSKILSKMLEI